MLMPIRELIFVYRSRAGAISFISDTFRHILHLNGCPLCAITHGLTGERSGMRECRAELGVAISYLHFDQLPTPHLLAAQGKFPAVLARTDRDIVLLLTPEMIDHCRGSLDELRARLVFQSAAKGLDLPSRPGASLVDAAGEKA